MRYCMRCGRGNEDSARFCGGCGAPLESVPNAGYPPQSNPYAPPPPASPYCGRCGRPIPPGYTACPTCGSPAGEGLAFCRACGRPLPPGATSCVCGAPTSAAYYYPVRQKSRVAAGLLGIFLGGLGVHNFYLGFTSRAVVQLVVSLLGYLLFWLILPLLAALGIAIWGLVEGIVILAGGRPVDAKGVPLKD